jgi:leucyl aminopeptidase
MMFLFRRNLIDMKFQKLINYLLLTMILVILAGCRKEDPEKIRRETFTSLLLSDINADSLEADVLWLQNLGTRFALADNHRRIAQRIKNRFIQMGYSDVKTDSFPVTKTYKNVLYEQMQYNVIATIMGTRYPDSLCIIGAHYDDILSSGDPFSDGRGANDNASGVAGVMELARVVNRNDFPPESTVKFIAFGAEELGLLGSISYAAGPEEFENAVSFMMNFDMIAYETGTSSEWYVNLIDYDNSHSLRKDAELICTGYTSLKYRNDNTNNMRSDSYPFFLNGYKALFFFSDEIDPNYHTLNDIVTNCNFGYSREIVKLACALLVSKN